MTELGDHSECPGPMFLFWHSFHQLIARESLPFVSFQSGNFVIVRYDHIVRVIWISADITRPHCTVVTLFYSEEIDVVRREEMQDFLLGRAPIEMSDLESNQRRGVHKLTVLP